MRAMIISISLAVACMGTAASAEFARVNQHSEFMELVGGKDLKRPFVKIQVTPQGEITGKGAAWPVTGNWIWKDGYFCRDLTWGGDPLGYNCQEVKAKDGWILFTSDQGNGDSAEFRLR